MSSDLRTDMFAWRLVYDGTEREVQVGDHHQLPNGTIARVVRAWEPTPGKTDGAVCLVHMDHGRAVQREYAPSTIGARWVKGGA